MASASDDIGRAQSEYLLTVKDDILIDLSARNMNATREAARSLRVVQNQFIRAQLRGVFYIDYLVSFNQRQSPKKVSENFATGVMIWMQAKGIAPKRGGQVVPRTTTNLLRSANAIAQSIVNNGNPYKKKRGIDLTKHLNDNKPELLRDVSNALLRSFKDKR